MIVHFHRGKQARALSVILLLAVLLLVEIPPLPRGLLAGTYVALGLTTAGLWMAELPSRPQAAGVEVGQRLAPLLEEGDRIVVVGLWQLEVRQGLAAASSGPLTVDVGTLPRSQATHPGWLDREALLSAELREDARALELAARERGSRVWLVWSPGPQIERDVLAAFDGWRRTRVAVGTVPAVELLTPPIRGEHE